MDHNMVVYYQVKHRLQAPTLARKFDISHWFPRGEDGRTSVGSRGYQNFSEGLPMQWYLGCNALMQDFILTIS